MTYGAIVVTFIIRVNRQLVMHFDCYRVRLVVCSGTNRVSGRTIDYCDSVPCLLIVCYKAWAATVLQWGVLGWGVVA